MKIAYSATITHEEDGSGYNVTFPDFKEAFTCGTTIEEALYMASDVLDLTLLSRIADKQEIPLPREEQGENIYMIAPDAKLQAALLIRFNLGDRKLADIARALDISWPAVSRLEDPTHWPSLRALEKTAAVLGKRLVLCME